MLCYVMLWSVFLCYVMKCFVNFWVILGMLGRKKFFSNDL